MCAKAQDPQLLQVTQHFTKCCQAVETSVTSSCCHSFMTWVAGLHCVGLGCLCSIPQRQRIGMRHQIQLPIRRAAVAFGPLPFIHCIPWISTSRVGDLKDLKLSSSLTHDDPSRCDLGAV